MSPLDLSPVSPPYLPYISPGARLREEGEDEGGEGELVLPQRVEAWSGSGLGLGIGLG